jgi:hypothetical protein
VSEHLEAPFTIRFMEKKFGREHHLELVDMNGLAVAVAPAYEWSEMNRLCLEYNKAFATRPPNKESWQ